jgi:hypothetical protein
VVVFIAPAYFVVGSFWGICSVISRIRRKNPIFDTLLLSPQEGSRSRTEDAGARPDNPLPCNNSVCHITLRFIGSCQSTDNVVLKLISARRLDCA